ncbi:MAG: N-acetyltransferase [Pseudomonadota bacterium]
MITYRDATPADAEALDAMAQAVWMETFAHSVSAENIATYFSEAYGADGKLMRDLRAGTAHFRLALEGMRIVGYCKVCPPWLPDAEPGAMQLSQIYVTYDHHGSGVGRVLLDWAIDTAQAAHATALLLTVWEENHRAFAFYKKNGFVHIGDYAFPVGKQVDTDHIMRLAL